VKRRRALGGDEDETLGGSGGDTYHAVRDHDSVEVGCIRCHASHTTDSEPGLLFISRARVQPICRECHEALGE
jgi:predicted CXXCH cytochrome family protein